MSSSAPRPSPFFYTPPVADADCLALLHLKRDNLLPVKLQASADDGYAEGAVSNTRFGSFPHSTLIGLDWGSQVRASKVDTGTRGRKGKRAVRPETCASDEQDDGRNDVVSASTNKRKSEGQAPLDAPASPAKKFKARGEGAADHALAPLPARSPVEAGSGFVHILQPTPETWTASLDHRTQVVYTPDSSYVLQRLRVRPGWRIIEAGAGSGSFTHAAARAVFSGYPEPSSPGSAARGKVFSFEYHEPRVETLRQEIAEHGLDGIVELTQRDVCGDGFLLRDGTSPLANAIFLDLPAPWHALKHLSRSGPNSALDPHTAVHLCTFSPCIEQVMATCSSLRRAGWTDISMVEMANKRIDVRRERVGLREEGLRGVHASPASVEEALRRLREVERQLGAFRGAAHRTHADGPRRDDAAQERKAESKQARLERLRIEAEARKLFREGSLATRAEPEVKTHTSYLVFAVLPRDWTEDDEREAALRYPLADGMSGGKAEPCPSRAST